MIFNFLSSGLNRELPPAVFIHKTLPVGLANERPRLWVKYRVDLYRLTLFLVTRWLRLQVVELSLFLQTLHYGFQEFRLIRPLVLYEMRLAPD